MTTPLLMIATTPLALEPIVAAVCEAGADRQGSDGAVATFLGLVRNHNIGRRVHYLDYEAYEPLAVRSFERITEEIRERWPGVRMGVHHRVGTLQVGEASVIIVVASPHRGDAFAVCRYTIERIKQISPIWKHEHFEGGDVWIEGATADPDDAIALAAAEKAACA